MIVQFTTKSEAKMMEFKSPLLAKGIAGLVALWVHFPPLLWTLCIMMTLDYLTGLFAAGAHGKIESAIARRGIYRKAAELGLAVAGFVVSNSMVPQIHQLAGVDLGSGICGALVLAELVSIVENADRAGVRVPSVLRRALAKIQSDEEPRS